MRVCSTGGTSKLPYLRPIWCGPPLRKKNVYVGVETRPVRKDGVLQLGSRAKLRVGNVRYDLGSAANKLGMSEAGLRKALNKNLRKLGFKAPR